MIDVRKSSFIFVAIALAGSSVFLLHQNHALREELRSADKLVRLLQAGAFEGETATAGFEQPVILVPLSSARTPAKTVSSRHNPTAQCDSCDLRLAAVRSQQFSNERLNSAGQFLLAMRNQYLSKQNTRFNLFVFFSATDCPACLKEAAIWERLALKGTALNLSVIGVADRSSKREADIARQQMGLTFPILFDINSALRSKFGIIRTPEKILVDQEGVIVLTDPGNETEETQKAFEVAVERRCEGR